MRGDQSGALGSLRESNREKVVKALQTLGVASRADIARWTGLSRSTVSSIVAELHDEGVVVDRQESGREAAGSGRPPALIALDPSAGFALGIDFGKRHLAVALADLSHELLGEQWVEMTDDYEAGEGMVRAAELVDRLLDDLGTDRGRVIGVGMGIPGPVQKTGMVGSSAILPGWAGTAPQDRMAELLDLPVRVGNDANLGALAESTWGAGRGSASVVYLKLATGHRRRHRYRRHGCSRAQAARPARSATRRSTRPATSAAAATAAASRPTPGPPRSPACCRAASARSSTPRPC